MNATMETLKAALTAALPELELRQEEPMSRHTTFRVGIPVVLGLQIAAAAAVFLWRGAAG